MCWKDILHGCTAVALFEFFRVAALRRIRLGIIV
jgi:hypothetical protein